MGAAFGHTHHGPAGAPATGRLAAVLVLTALYTAAEAAGGLFSGSLALLADSGHMLSDVAGLGLALLAMGMARRPPTPARTYGYQRMEILAALANGAALVAIAVWVLVEAAGRLASPPPVAGGVVMAIAAGGLAMNLVGMGLLSGDRGRSLNLRGAWLHLMADALGSVAVIASGALIWAFGWRWADPAASALVALLVVHAAWSLVKEAAGVLMESAPGHLDVDEVRTAMAGVDGVAGVHDLHVWTITSGHECLSGHVVARAGQDPHRLLDAVRGVLGERFGIDHVTIQVEPEGFPESKVCP
jgi:cobalt-zinc-cadmium efflux system protein